MKITNFKIILGVFITCIIGLFILIINLNKPHKDIRNSKADLVLNASSLLSEFTQNEKLANSKYLDNIIQIKGTISDISATNGNSVITLTHSGLDATVICHLLPEENIKSLQLNKNKKIVIKGRCTGFLMDVVLVNCVIINNYKK